MRRTRSCVVAPMRETDQRHYCVIAALHNGACVENQRETMFGHETLNESFAAALVDHRWVFARSNLGGYGDGHDRVDESAASFVGGRFVSVGGIASHQLSVLRGRATLTLLADNDRACSFA